MPSARTLLRRFSDRAFGTAFDRALARTHVNPGSTFLFFWNRGLGDIALGLVPMFLRIRRERPGARIAVITREELREPFTMTGADAIHVLPGLAREARIDITAACESLGLRLANFDAAFDYPDPNRWLEKRRGEYPPALAWNAGWDGLADGLVRAQNGAVVIAAHVSSETARFYGYPKDWPAPSWQALFARFPDPREVQWVLLGIDAAARFDGANVTDLRSRTSFPALMSLLRHHCRVLVAPDSGVLTMAFYLQATFAIDVISLWSDPRQGVLLQGCASPNPRLHHVALQGPGEDVRNLAVDAVEAAVRGSVAAART